MQHPGPYWGVSDSVPSSAGLGWEDNPAQLLCLSWGFSSLPHLHSKEAVVPVPPTSWPDSAPTKLCHDVSCWDSIPAGALVSLCPSHVKWNHGAPWQRIFLPLPWVTSVSQRCLAGAGGAAAAPLARGAAVECRGWRGGQVFSLLLCERRVWTPGRAVTYPGYHVEFCNPGALNQ